MFDNKNHQKPQLIELMQPFRTPPRKGPEPKNMDSNPPSNWPGGAVHPIL